MSRTQSLQIVATTCLGISHSLFTRLAAGKVRCCSPFLSSIHSNHRLLLRIGYSISALSTKPAKSHSPLASVSLFYLSSSLILTLVLVYNSGPLRFASRFVLVGDHYQLPPLVRCPEAK